MHLKEGSKSPDDPASQTGNEGPQQRRRPPSPSQIARTGVEDEEAYILTLLTDRAHHKRMTEVRNKYFPRRLNRLAAHLTLFHALPGSKLDSDIIPVIERVAGITEPFTITASEPFRLNKRGIAIDVLTQDGGNRAKELRDQLQKPWYSKGFLSQQDAGKTSRSFPHYTVMNKVDDEVEVQKALGELKAEFKTDRGIVEGFALYRYEKGFWRWVRKFEFRPAEKTEP